MKWMKNRNGQIWIGIIVMMMILTVRLLYLTVIEGEKWEIEAGRITVKHISQTAPRGQIFDRYGRLMAGNEACFSVQFSEGSFSNEEINDQALEIANIIEACGDTLNDTFPILLENDRFVYGFDEKIRQWLLEQKMPEDFTAEQAFKEACHRNEMEENVDIYEAQEALINVYGSTLPISVKRMEFTYQLDKKEFVDRYYSKEMGSKEEAYSMSAEEMFYFLRDVFQIDDHRSDEDARKIMILRNELKQLGYLRYLPVTAASDISPEAVMVFSEKSMDLPGVEIVAETRRYYPNGTLAAHVLGYMGKISDSEKEQYEEKGYKPGDMVGKEGIEKAFEEVLRGTDAVTSVQVDAYGRSVRILNEEHPKKGQDTYLTIDLELQKTAEASLKKALEGLQAGTGFQSEWGDFNYPRKYPNANAGAVAVVHIKTGDILALASYPDFDPNLFAKGISVEDWLSLQPDNPRDPLAPRPLFNTALRTAVQPGSTFKPITAIAALDNGLDPNKKLQDAGYVQFGGRTYGCVSWNLSRRTDGLLNLVDAMEVSCNYYFYDISTGKDWARGGIPLDMNRMDIETISSYARQFGFGLPTGVEITESVAPVPSAEQKLIGTQNAVKNILIGRADIYFEEEIVKDKDLLNLSINKITSWVEENPQRGELITRLEANGIKKEKVEEAADELKFTYFNYAQWTDGDMMNISIGQGENACTPLQAANSMVVLGRGGMYNKVSLIYGIEGEERRAKEPGIQTDVADEAYFDYVMEGMRRVAHGSRGSARTLFSGFPVEVAVKTGTAQRSGKIPAVDEVDYIKENLHRINSRLSFTEVEAEMKRLLKEYPEVYVTQDAAVLQAVVNKSRAINVPMDFERINAYKESYEDYAWFVALAPAREPQIAVAVLLFQGGTGNYAGPVAREIIGQYLDLNKEYVDFSLETRLSGY